MVDFHVTKNWKERTSGKFTPDLPVDPGLNVIVSHTYTPHFTPSSADTHPAHVFVISSTLSHAACGCLTLLSVGHLTNISSPSGATMSIFTCEWGREPKNTFPLCFLSRFQRPLFAQTHIHTYTHTHAYSLKLSHRVSHWHNMVSLLQSLVPVCVGSKEQEKLGVNLKWIIDCSVVVHVLNE